MVVVGVPWSCRKGHLVHVTRDVTASVHGVGDLFSLGEAERPGQVADTQKCIGE